MPTLKGTEVSLSYVQCFLYLLQKMSLFHSTRLDNFWTDFINSFELVFQDSVGIFLAVELLGQKAILFFVI